MTFMALLIIAVCLSFISLRYYNLLLSLGASIGWLCLMAHNLNNPPTGITQGSAIHEWMTMGFIAVAIAMLLMWFRNRGRGYTGYPRTAQEQSEYDRELNNPSPRSGGMMDMSETEYRTYIRKKLHPRIRRR